MTVIQRVASALQENLGESLDELARESQVIKRQRVFTGRTLALIVITTLLQTPDASWTDFRLTCATFGLEVSQAAIEKRFSAGQPLVDFFRQALERALQQVLACDPSAATLLAKFSAVLLGDATTIELPDELAHLFAGCGGSDGTSRAALKIQVLFDLKSGRLVHLSLEPGKASDCKSPIVDAKVEAGSLLIFDLGYFDLGRFKKVADNGCKFLSRLLFGTKIYTLKDKELSLLNTLRRTEGNILDIEILLGAGVKLPCRLVGVRVPEEVANRRRQKAREKAAKKGGEPSEQYLELLGWSLFVTNSSKEELTWKEVVVLYRSRWQIELLFRVWKSKNGLDKHRSKASVLEVLAVFYAKLLGLVVQHWILIATAWQMPQRSVQKAVMVLAKMIQTILLVLQDRQALEEALLKLQQVIVNFGGTANRPKDPSHAQLLNDPEFLTWLGS